MTILISKRHFFKFYFSIAFGTIIFIAIATFLLIKYQNSENDDSVKAKELMPVFSVACYAFAIYNVYRYFKNAPRITLNNNSISFGNKTYPFNDIAEVSLTGKKPFKYVTSFPMEAAAITFKNGETKYIFDNMYSNSWQLKLFLKEVAVDKSNFFVQSSQDIENTELDNEYYDMFKGNQFTSLRGILLWGFIGFLTYTVLTSNLIHSTASLLVYIISCTAWFFIHSLTMNYFEVSQNFLVIKNHNLLWRKTAYRLSNIKEIVFETKGKMPNCLRVITKDFRNKLYLAGTLRDKTWLELKSKLKSYNIQVRNECIYEEKTTANKSIATSGADTAQHQQ